MMDRFLPIKVKMDMKCNLTATIKLSTRRKIAIQDILTSTNRLCENPSILLFLDQFIDCEIIAKKVIEYFNLDHNKKLDNDTYRVDALYQSLEYFGVEISKIDVNNIFRSYPNSEYPITLRNLRNSYVHSRSETSCTQIKDNYGQYTSLMIRFLDAVKIAII
jgi:hypothetical protein